MDHQQIVDHLLIPAWNGVPTGYKTKYARNIWDQFEAQLKSASYTSRLTHFWERFVRSLDIQIRSEDVGRCKDILTSGEDRAVLRALRDETTTLVLMLRLANEQRRDNIKQQERIN